MAKQHNLLKHGAFGPSLKRNNKEIKEARAFEIVDDTHLKLKRKIEDTEREITSLIRDRRTMLDLSLTIADSLILAQDFDSSNFLELYKKKGIQIRNKAVELQILEADYEHLFVNPMDDDKYLKAIIGNPIENKLSSEIVKEDE